jgi:L-fuculokinase
MKTPIVAVFDIGKTNKKAFLFDQHYQMVWEESVQLPETTDPDGYACEDIGLLTQWVLDTFAQLQQHPSLTIRAVNFSAYGASWVHLGTDGEAITPLYNYLKPYPEALSAEFYAQHGSAAILARETASPTLGSLNSGMQLYRLKREQPALFQQIHYSLHLPQYLSFLLTGHACSDLSSIGCHTQLWHFDQQQYHPWVIREGLEAKLAPIDRTLYRRVGDLVVGTGLHDSSAALIPYLAQFQEPFVLLSTGTWNITLHPFNHHPLTDEELAADCLCYLSYRGQAVKAARLFAGHLHETGCRQLAERWQLAPDTFRQVCYQPELLEQPDNSYAADYHRLMQEIVAAQVRSTRWVLDTAPVQHLYVDGGFSHNEIFMQLLAEALPDVTVYAAEVAQASALGAALAVHEAWNDWTITGEHVEVRVINWSKVSH